MHSTGLRPLVADLLQRRGFTVHQDDALEGRSGATYEVPLVAEDDLVLLIDFKESPDPVEPEDTDYLGKLVDDAGADFAILIHQGPAGTHHPQRGDIALWGPSRLRSIVGDHAMHDQIGTPLLPLPLGPNLARSDPSQAVWDADETGESTAAELFPWSEQTEPEATASTDSGFDLSVLDEPVAPVIESASQFDNELLGGILPSAFQEEEPLLDELNSIPSLDDQPTAPAPESGFPVVDLDALESIDTSTPVDPDGLGFMPSPSGSPGPTGFLPSIQATEARAMVLDRMGSIDQHSLVLLPVHIIDYECDLFVDGTLRQDTVGGRIQVRGDRKYASLVESGQLDPATTGTIDWTGEVDLRPFRRDADVALSEAKQIVMETHTRMVDVQAEDEASDFMMMERKKLAPDADQMRLSHRAATYRPAWRFDGPNGHVVLDAMSGDVLDEQLQRMSGDTIILD